MTIPRLADMLNTVDVRTAIQLSTVLVRRLSNKQAQISVHNRKRMPLIFLNSDKTTILLS